jgi:hypothetical protein
MIYKIKFLILILLVPITLSAENTVILKNGTNLKGKVISQDNANLTVKLATGNTQTVVKSQILKVIYKDLSEQEAQKIRAIEEQKLKAKEEAERLKKEKAEKLAEEKERKRQEAEDRKAAELQKTIDLKEKEEAEKLAKRNADKEKQEKDWIEANKDKYVTSEASKNCGSANGILWRSAILPGWGQLCGGHYVSAGIIFTSLIGSIAYSQNSLRPQVSDTRAQYDLLSTYAVLGGPISRFSLEYISSSSDLTNLIVENVIVNDLVSNSKNDYKAANYRYMGSLAGIGIIYFANLFHAYVIGKDTLMERPTISMAGERIKEGWDAKVQMEKSLAQTGLPVLGTYAEIRYSILLNLDEVTR